MRKETQADDKTVLYGLKCVFPSHTSEDWEMRGSCGDKRQGNGKCGKLYRTTLGEWEMWNVVQTNVRGMVNVKQCADKRQGNRK